MPVTSLNHVTLIVSDLERSARLWREGLGATEVYDSSDKNHSLSQEKFFLLGGVWIALMRGEPAARSYRHVAFHVPETELPTYEHRLRALDAEIRPPRPRVQGEGLSLYFHDYGNNLLELHSGSLEDRLRAYARKAL
jgi:fosfomycin resistance protein FosX